ncbi:MAG: divergent polysaccharide deacetylase family protein [Pseudomonadota bacterium]|nr:divergent polysaccharide deacetylase family protein [Pseudomonadota bacterium]
MRRLLLGLGLLLTLSHAAAQAPRIAIIIDDLGYHRLHGQAIADLPAAVTCAVIPYSPHGRRLAERASLAGKEVLVHMPMAAHHHAALDRGGLRVDMNENELLGSVRQALSQIPQARGLNNHMGSALTEQNEPMEWLMAELKAHQLFFVDSRTSSHTVAQKVASQQGLANAGRDIFLDNNRDLASINAQFNKLIRLARQRGRAIAIGHPYPETVHYLQQVLPLMEEAGIEVVPVSSLLDTPSLDTATTGGGNHAGS